MQMGRIPLKMGVLSFYDSCSWSQLKLISLVLYHIHMFIFCVGYGKTGKQMTALLYVLVALLIVTAILSLRFFVGRSRRKAIEREKAEQLDEANRPLEVWICRCCGFMSLIRNEECTWCGAPQTDDFFSRTISRKDFTAQLQKPSPKPYNEGTGNVV